MKVILLKDVAKIGKRFEVVEVPDGYALNMLIPKGMAKPGTPENIKRVNAQKSQVSKQQEASDSAFAEAVETLAAKGLTVALPANEQGHLFEAVKAEKVVEAAAAAGYVIAPAAVGFQAPIKEVGDHTVTLQQGGVSKDIILTVTAA